MAISAWERSGNERKTTYRQIFLLIGVGLGSATWVAIAFSVRDNADHARDIREQLDREYTSAITAWQKDVADYSLCLTTASQRVETRAAVRDILFDYADGIGSAIAQVFPDSAEGAELGRIFAADRKAYVNARYQPLDLAAEQANCVEPGPVPVNPNGG